MCISAKISPERLEIRVGESENARLSCREYDLDRTERLGLALHMNRWFVTNVACGDASIL